MSSPVDPIQHLKIAADLLEAQAAQITGLTAKVAALQVPAKVASAPVDHCAAAKTAGDLLMSKRLITSEALRDNFAAKIAGDHAECIRQLTKLASLMPGELRRVGEPTKPASPSQEASPDSWAAAYHQRYGAV